MLSLTGIATYLAHRTVQEEKQERFQSAVQSTQRDIQERLHAYIGALMSTSGLFAAVQAVDVNQFQDFVERMNLESRFPGIQGIGYTRRVPPGRRERFNELLQRLDPEFRMWPEGERPEYHAIMFLEPMNARNRVAMGYDMYSEPVRRAAMAQARDTGQPVASGKVTLVQEIDQEKQPGFLIYVPVYDQEMPHETVEQRREALRGFVFSPFRAHDLMRSILGDPNENRVHVAVYAGEQATPENLLYASAPGEAFTRSPRSGYRLDFANHSWSLLFAPGPRFTDTGISWLTWLTLAIGVLLSVLVSGIVLTEARARSAGERTAEELRQSGDALRRSQEELRLVADALPVLVSYVDPDQRYRFVNRAYEEWFGLERNRIQGMPMRELLGEEAYEFLQPHIQRVLAGQEADFEGRVNYLRIGPRYVSVSYIPQFGEGGEVAGFVTLVTDLSARKQMEESLRESEARFRHMADTAPVMLWVSGTDTLFNYVNKPWLDFRGRTLEEERGMGWTEGLHPDDAKQFLEIYFLAFNGRNGFQAECRMCRYDEEYRWVMWQGVPRFTSEGKFVGFIGSCLDITERKRVEETARFLSEASTLLAASLDYRTTLERVAHLAVPSLADWCAVDMVEADGTLQRLAVAHIDPDKEKYAWEMYRRYPPKPDSNVGVMRVIRTGEAEIYPEVSDEMLKAATHDEEHYRIAKELGLRSGIVVPLIARGRTLGAFTVVSAESGRRYGPADLAFFEDLAYRAAVAMDNARLFGEIQENDRRKDEFLATLAHELRNPLAPIQNAVHLLRMRPSEDPMLARAEEVLERQVQHMARLVDDLLDVSRITRGQIELRKESLELSSVVDHAVQTSRPLIEEQGHEIHVSLPAEPIRLHADPTRLIQVIANLLNNAAKYTPQGGRIDVTAERKGSDVLLRVRDTGRGIKKEMLPRIFDLFTQEDPTLDRTQGGLGLGLTLVRQLVERHGGSVSAYSEGQGQGSEFVVRLPIYVPGREENPAPVPSQASAGSQETAGSGASKRILVVDDNRDAAVMLSEVLEIWGHEVRTAHDGPEALDLAKAFRPEVVLLDIGLPELDGYEVTRRLRRDPDMGGLTIIALTGYGQETDRRRALEAGFNRHLTKPVDLEGLRKLL